MTIQYSHLSHNDLTALVEISPSAINDIAEAPSLTPKEFLDKVSNQEIKGKIEVFKRILRRKNENRSRA